MADLTLAAHLHAAVERTYKNLVADLLAMDIGTAVDSSHHGLRPAILLVAECGFVNELLAALVATGQFSMPSPEERAAFYAAVTTPAAALEILDAGTQKLYAAIDATASGAWSDIVPGRFGPWARADAAGYAALHMMYHDGQLNTLHLLHGDTEIHWE